MNNINLIGNLTREVEVKFFPNTGTPYAILNIANNKKYKHNDEVLEKTLFIDVKIIGEMANMCKKYLDKGSKVAVSGRLEQENWEDKETKQKRNKILILANNIQFLDKKSNSQNQENEEIEKLQEQQTESF